MRRALNIIGRGLRAVAVVAYEERYDLFALAGAGLLGGGVWARWGAPWACMLWGALLVAVSVTHAIYSRKEEA